MSSHCPTVHHPSPTLNHPNLTHTHPLSYTHKHTRCSQVIFIKTMATGQLLPYLHTRHKHAMSQCYKFEERNREFEARELSPVLRDNRSNFKFNDFFFLSWHSTTPIFITPAASLRLFVVGGCVSVCLCARACVCTCMRAWVCVCVRPRVSACVCLCVCVAKREK